MSEQSNEQRIHAAQREVMKLSIQLFVQIGEYAHLSHIHAEEERLRDKHSDMEDTYILVMEACRMEGMLLQRRER